MTCRSSLEPGAAVTAALELAADGFDVFPCRPHSKRPATAHGLNDATRDPGLIQGWWEQWPDANLAVRTGSARFVVDVDPDGVVAFGELWREQAGTIRLPHTPTARTPRGGFHMWLAADRPVRNSASKLAPGIDIRGDGGYVLVAPSTVSGRTYKWGAAPLAGHPIQPAPEWLLERLDGTRTTTAGQARVVSYWRELTRDGVREGARNDSCARLAGHLLARGVDPFVALELVVAWDQQRNRPPLGADETAQVVRSIARRETERWQ